MNILIHGTLDYDIIMKHPGRFQDRLLPEYLDRLSMSLFIEDVEEKFGGNAGAIAYSLRLLGESPMIISAIGHDGQEYIDHLLSQGLTTEYIEVVNDIRTSRFTVVSDSEHHQLGFFYAGALQRNIPFSASDFPADNSIMLLTPRDNNPETLAYAQQCRQIGLPYIFDPGQTIDRFTKHELRQLIDGAFMLTINDYEFQTLQRLTDIREEELLGMTQAVVVTQGEDGSKIYTHDGIFDIPRCSSENVVDTTGAGDAYRAGLLKGISIGASFPQMGRLGAVAAAYAIEHVGGQEHHYSLDDFCQRYEEQFSEACPLRPKLQPHLPIATVVKMR